MIDATIIYFGKNLHVNEEDAAKATGNPCTVTDRNQANKIPQHKILVAVGFPFTRKTQYLQDTGSFLHLNF